MSKITAVIFMLIVQFILSTHDLSIFNWQWWILMFSIFAYDFFWRLDE